MTLLSQLLSVSIDSLIKYFSASRTARPDCRHANAGHSEGRADQKIYII